MFWRHFTIRQEALINPCSGWPPLLKRLRLPRNMVAVEVAALAVEAVMAEAEPVEAEPEAVELAVVGPVEVEPAG